MTGIVTAYAALAERILSGPPRLGSVRLVAIDGPAGSGKTTFAARLSRALGAAGARTVVVPADDLLDGWRLASFWPRLRECVLEPLSRGEPGRYQRYDWLRRWLSDDWVDVPVPDVLVLEGVASAYAPAQPSLTTSVFVVADDPIRLDRGIDRDGEDQRSDWLRWMDDERRHFAEDATRARAEIVVDGCPAIPHDREETFVALLPS